jgi:hypothetical protein
VRLGRQRIWGGVRMDSGSIRDGGQPPPKIPRPTAPAGTGASASQPAKSRRLWKKILTPIVLALIGGVLVLFAVVLYRSPGDPSTVSFTTLEVKSLSEVGKITYHVSQASPSVTEISTEITLPLGTRAPSAEASISDQYFELFLPPGFTFQTCPRSSCRFVQANDQYVSYLPLKFKTVTSGLPRPTGVATVTFFVRAHGFGYSSNSVTALAAIPQVFYFGPGSEPTLTTVYDNAPAASSYDWSAFPPVASSGTAAVWDVPVVSGATQGRVAVGINHANQAKESNETFIAGALLGLAGGALVAAVQEALHAND